MLALESEHRVGVQPVRGMDAAARIADRDDAGAGLVIEAQRRSAGVAAALDDDGRPGDRVEIRHQPAAQSLLRRVQAASCGRFVAAQ